MSSESVNNYMHRTCRNLYRRNVDDAGFSKPSSLLDMQCIIVASGASLLLCADAPADFMGVQIGRMIYVNASALIPEWRRICICAHEWCHWLRRSAIDDAPLSVWFYPGEAHSPDNLDEIIACNFEKLFDIRETYDS